jgi:reactive intermediate/imine deaminase
MSRKVIQTDAAPAAVGPYSQAVEVDGWLWISGQIPLDPASGELIQGDIERSTRRVLKNLVAIIEAAGGSTRDVVRVTIYLTDLGQFATVNAIYAEVFDTDPPARACVEVSALPKGADVEMDAVVRLGR